MNQKIDIQPTQFYSLKELVLMKAFGWVNHTGDVSNDTRAYRREIDNDQSNKNILRAIVRGTGRNTRYSFKGSNVAKFIATVESGQY